MGVNNIEVKKLNRRNVLTYMLSKEQVSKRDVAVALHLSVPTVTQCMVELQDMGLVQECGAMDSMGGRKSMGYQSVKAARTAIGVDITRQHINIVVIDLAMGVLYSKRVTRRLRDTQESYEGLRQIICEAIGESQAEPSSILGMGISLPSIIDETGTRLNGLHEQMEISTNLYEIVKDWFPFPVILENDATSAGRAEVKFREAVRNMVYFFISPSVGGSVIIDGKAFYGKRGRTGEFGHMTLIPGGKQCYCGRRGCVNAYCSTELLSDHTEGNLYEFFRRLESKDEECVSIWEKYMDSLALAVHNLVISFDMDIVIGGYLGQHIGPYMSQLEKRVEEMDHYLADLHFMEPAILKYEASAIGAAVVFIERFLEEV